MANSKTNSKKKTTSSKKATSTKAVKQAKKTNTTPVETKVEPKVEVKKEVKKTNTKNNSTLKENYTLIGLILVAILLIVNIVIVSNGHKAKVKNGEEIIASVKGKNFSADTLFEQLKKANGSNTLINLVDEYIVSKEITDDQKVEAKKTAKEQLDSVKEQYTSAGYKWEDVLSQYGYENEDKLLDEMLLTAEKEIIVKNKVKKSLTDEEIQKYYDENVYNKYSAKHILITPEVNDEMSDEDKNNAEEAAKAKAQEVIDKLNNGEAWNDLVAAYSQDTGSKENEGLIENFTKGDVVDEFFSAVEGLKENEYTKEPVKSTYGYHIIYKVSTTKKESLKKMKKELVEKIVENKLNEDANLYSNTLVELRKKYKLEINDATIKNAYEKSINTSEK